jgi:glycosyltransferase involved in cell wall biosynthesis
MTEPRARPRVLCVTEHSDRPEAETFIGLHKRGYPLHVMCSPAARHFSRLREAGVPVTPLKFRAKVDRRAIRDIRERLDSEAIDILHAFNNRTVLNGLIAARGRSVRIVAYRGIVGNVSFLSPASWMRYLSPRVDRVVCVAEAVREYFLGMRLFGMRLSPEKFVTIYKGHDLSWYRDAPSSLEGLGPERPRFLVCCVANWRPRKGVEVLLRAFDRLPRDADLGLVLVGHMDNPSLQRQIAASPAKDRIYVLGRRDDAPAIVAACDVAVLPALKREGLPKTVIEAMAYGVAPIVTNVGGSPELVLDGQTGLVVPPGDVAALADALLRLYRDPPLRERLGRAARERIGTHFRIDTTIEETAALYDELC